jgi:hypothetical protein
MVVKLMEQKQSQPNHPADVIEKGHFTRFKSFLHKKPPKKRLAIVAGVSLFVLVAGSLAAFSLIKNPVNEAPVPVITSTYVAPPPEFKSPLTGKLVSEEASKRPVTGIMIENSIDARPQSGLYDAGVVFEAIAEGGITRFMALYQESRPGNVGPIRSARPYYVEWAKGFDASYLHVGGSPEGLALIRSLGVKDLDQSRFGDRIASRVSNRFAPHNMYSDFDRIDAINNEQGFTSSDFTPFARKELAVIDPTIPFTATKISFDISGANYNTSYTYKPETNSYDRVMASRAHTDQESGKQISPEVVVAMVTDYSINPNRIHSAYRTTGIGEVLIFQDGSVLKGTWSRESQSASLKFLDAAGNPLELNAGQTWITAIPAGRVSYTP